LEGILVLGIENERAGDGALPDAVGSVLDVERPGPKSDLRFGDAVAIRDGDGVVAGLRGQLLRSGVDCLDRGVTGLEIGHSPVCGCESVEIRLMPRGRIDEVARET
jgi:hypothetical protein